MTGRDGDDVDMDAAGMRQRWGEGGPVDARATPDVRVVVTDDGPLTAQEEATLVAQIEPRGRKVASPSPPTPCSPS